MRTSSSEQTKSIAAKFATSLKGGDVVFLEGELGSGKTTFAQGLLSALGYADPVKSPTFTILNVYNLKHPIFDRVAHIDLYRIDDPRELVCLGLEEFLCQPRTLTLIEWPKDFFLRDDLSPIVIRFRIESNNKHDISFYGKI
jgi:tRNA threonylcarbamoyladenosine biosynthesis protein TsaE